MAQIPVNQRKKKVPERKCLGCGNSLPKPELARVVRAPDGGVSLDLGGKKPGRGAYICKNAKCLEKAWKSKRIAKSLECDIPDELYAALKEEISAQEDGNG